MTITARQLCLHVLAGLLLVTTTTAMAQTCKNSIPDRAPNSRYQMNADGTVVDLQTGLMWMRCAMGQNWDAQNDSCSGTAKTYDWKAALDAVQTLDQATGYAGYTDWRLPNVRELASLVRFRCRNPAINANAFPQTPGMDFWSSTPVNQTTGEDWAVSFKTGQAGTSVYNQVYAIRLVRAGALAP